MKRTALVVALMLGLALGAGGYAVAQMDHSQMNHGAAMDHGETDHGGMNHDTESHGAHGNAVQDIADMPASTAAFVAANDAMHADMMIEFTGDADVDFIAGMIPHHEGAIVMAEIVLEHGQDQEVAELARAIIAAQAEEIAWMRAWLAERGR